MGPFEGRDLTEIFAKLQAAAHAGAFGVNELALPTAEQCRAGNYLKGRVTLHGMPVAIEVPQGQRRMGKSDGKPWSTILMAHYGYFVGTSGADGDPLDVFIGPVPERNQVWVVNQVDKDGEFDEHKILIGFIDEDSARAAYMNSYERGWTGLGSLVACTIFQLKWWMKYGNTTKPLTDKALPHDGNTEMNEITWDSAANPVGCDLSDLIYRLRREDGDGLMLDAVTVDDIMEVSEGEEALDALVVQYNKAERKSEQLLRIMESVGGDVKPTSVQVTQPFKQRGTTNVVFLYELSDGQTVSIWMHNPDSTPNKILPQDELVSWRWMLNKKDITLLVAPERGVDINVREAARRIMKLAQQNSARFAKANTARAERMQNIGGMKGAVAAKEAELAALDILFADLTEKAEAKRANPPAKLENNDQEGAERGDVSTPEGQSLRSKAVKAELAKLGWDVSGGSLTAMLTLDGSVYSLRSDQSAKTGIVWRDEGSNQSWSDDGTLSAADMAAKIDGEFRQGVADARAQVSGNGVGILEVQTAMRAVSSGSAWWLDAGINHVVNKGVENGWVSRRSTTQADWTQAGIDALNAAKPETDPVSDEPHDLFENMDELPDEVRALLEGADLEEATYESLKLLREQVEAHGYTFEFDLDATAYDLRKMTAEEIVAREPLKPQPDPAPVEDAELTAAKQYLQEVIDGQVDFMDEGLAERLEKIHDDYAGEEGIMDLFEQAAQAYSEYMVEQARAALA